MPPKRTIEKGMIHQIYSEEVVAKKLAGEDKPLEFMVWIGKVEGNSEEISEVLSRKLGASARSTVPEEEVTEAADPQPKGGRLRSGTLRLLRVFRA